MKKFRRIIAALLFIAFIGVNIPVFNVKAADINVSIALSASSVNVGDSVTATISVSGSNISAYTIYVSYSSNILSYSSGSGMVSGGGGTATISGTGAGSVSITFTAIASGTASISTYGDDAWSIEATQLSISHAGVNVTVSSPSAPETPTTTEKPSNTEATENTTEATTEEQDTSKCFLKSLSISPGTLEPAFSSRTTSYFVQLDDDVKAVDVNAVAEYSSSRVSVSGADSITPGENYINITVTSENGATKTYYIRVMAGEEKGEARTTIDGRELFFVMDKELSDIPEGYKAVDETYDDWDIVAFMSPNKKLLLVCLEDKDSKQSFYIYDKEKNIFTLYREYSANQNRYIILEWRNDIKVPKGCVEAQINIDGELIQAYSLGGDYYLIYAMNIEGDEGIYLYDKKEKTFMRYMGENEETVATETEATPEDATQSDVQTKEPDDEGFFTRQMLLYFLMGAAALVFILLIIITCVSVKNHKLKKKMKLADNDEDEEDVDEVKLIEDTGSEIDSKGGLEIGSEADLEKVENNTEKNDESVKTVEAEENVDVEDKTVEAGESLDVEDKNVEAGESPDAEDKNVEAGESPDAEDKNVETEESPDIEDKTVEADENINEKIENPDKKEDMIPQITKAAADDKSFEEYKKQSEEIRNKIKVSYDSNMDSAFDIKE